MIVTTRQVIISCLFLVHFTISAQKSTKISGYIRDAASGEALTSVLVQSQNDFTSTNNYGFFSLLSSETTKDTLRFSYLGYHTKIVAVGTTQDVVSLNIELEESSVDLNTVHVYAEKAKPLSVERITATEIKNLPALLGEKDALKLVQLLPGTQKASEGNSGLYVRGGNQDQNLVLLDEAPVYNLHHFFGLFSVFNGDAIKDFSFYKGNIPARYGGRLSSVLDFTVADGNKDTWKGEGGIGLLSSRLVLQGPLQKDKASILVAARRSYFDLLFTPILRAVNQVGAGYFFHDYNLKANYQLDDKNYFLVSAYFGKDRYKYSEPAALEGKQRDENRFFWHNATATLRWNHLGKKDVFMHSSLIFNTYRFGVDFTNYLDVSNGEDVLIFSESGSSITDLSFKHEWFWVWPKQEWRAGVFATQHFFTPSKIRYENDLNRVNNLFYEERLQATEAALYIEDNIRMGINWTADIGLRTTLMRYDGLFKIFPEPRLSLTYQREKWPTLSLGYTRTNQFIQLLSNTGVSLPTDFWIPSTKEIQPQQADQYNVGISKSFAQRKWIWSTEFYYKNMRHISAYREGSSFINLDSPTEVTPKIVPWQDILVQGMGTSYGIEGMLEKKTGKWTGWLAYTWSKTQHQFPDLNNGKSFAPNFDRRHQLSLTTQYQIRPHKLLSATWTLASPNPVDVPIKAIPVQTEAGLEYVPYHGDRGAIRERFYHRLDVAMQFKKEKKRYTRTWEIGVYNLYNRKNPSLYRLNTQATTDSFKYIVEAQSFFMFIPNVSYNFSF